jgi:glycosyltransferase involved in cell wall biosynthesis
VTGPGLRLLHFSTSDLNGGAALAAYRLHRALADAGQSSELIARQKLSGDADVTGVPAYINPWRARGRRLLRLVSRQQETTPSPPAFNLDVDQDLRTDLFYRHPRGAVDVVVLHSVTRLLTVREIHRLHEHYRCPVVWVMADQAPLTGGCHYAYECRGYTRSCGTCPQLQSTDPEDGSRTTWQRRSELLRELPIAFVAPSSGAARWVRESSVFAEHRVEVIPAIANAKVFRPIARSVARELLDLAQEARIVLAGAGNLMHFRKGLANYFPEALTLLPGPLRDRLFVLALGARGEELLELLPVSGRALGTVRDEVAIALAYQAADVFVCPTIADAGPLMIPESLLCGTPVVAFDEGYAVDLLAHDTRIGYLCRRREAAEIARGLEQVLGIDDTDESRTARRRVALPHAPERVAEAHLALYAELTRRD